MSRLPVIIDARRTPLAMSGKGGLVGLLPEELLAFLVDSAIENKGVSVEQVEDLIAAASGTESPTDPGPGRAAALLSRLPDTIPGRSVFASEVSGLEAVALAHSLVETGDADCLLAGAAEVNPRPWKDQAGRPHPAILSRLPGLSLGQGLLAEELASQYGITRLAQENYALESHRRSAEAMARNLFAAQISPVRWSEKKWSASGLQNAELSLSADELPRDDLSLEAMARLPRLFRKDGTLTAATCAARADGAGLLAVMAGKKAADLGIHPLGRLQSRSLRAGDPGRLLWNQAEAVRDVIKDSGLAMEDIACVQIAEPFAAIALALMKELGIDGSRVNPQGGCLSLGYASGASGAILSVMLLHELRRIGERYGVVTVASSQGLVGAALFESFAG